jgi:hypothetical protein
MYKHILPVASASLLRGVTQATYTEPYADKHTQTGWDEITSNRLLQFAITKIYLCWWNANHLGKKEFRDRGESLIVG